MFKEVIPAKSPNIDHPGNSLSITERARQAARLLTLAAVLPALAACGSDAKVTSPTTLASATVTTSVEIRPTHAPTQLTEVLTIPTTTTLPLLLTVPSVTTVETPTPTNETVYTTPIAKSGNSYFSYAGGYQFIVADGASVALSQAQPTLSGADDHSLMELAVSSEDGQQMVEAGWIVTTSSTDPTPRLFVDSWMNGVSQCYNGCGFEQTSTDFEPGNPVTIGAVGKYAIKHITDAWHISYNDIDLGYFPDSLWQGTFTKGQFVQVFGEVSSAKPTACDQMGNGIAGSAAGSAEISNFSLFNSSIPADLIAHRTTGSTYDVGAPTPTGMRIGGPGTC